MTVSGRFPFLVLCLVGLLQHSAPAQTPPPAKPKAAPTNPVDKIAITLEPDKKLIYKEVGDRKLEMHVFLPANWKASDRRSCLLAIHGGGWSGSEPRRFYPFASHYRDQGMVGISLQYRLVKGKAGSTVFECVKDSRTAMRYLKQHAAELGIDPDKIIAFGGSAGGHLAAGTAQFDGVDEATDDLKVSTRPAAVVLLFPVIDTSKEGYGNALIGEHWADISPLHRVKKGLPPMIMFHGTGDVTTPFKGAKAFHEAMEAAGNRCDFVINQGGVHGYLMNDQKLLDEMFQKSDQFLVSLGLLAATKQP